MTSYQTEQQARAAYFAGRYGAAIPLLEKVVSDLERTARTLSDYRALDRFSDWLFNARFQVAHSKKVAA